MRAIWETSQQKFAYWLFVELAVLEAREACGHIPGGTTREMADRLWVDESVTNAIERRDREIRHDLNAFVEMMRLQLILRREEFERIISIEDDERFNRNVTEGLAAQANSFHAGYFHDGMTSYDTEEPAMALLLRDSCNVIGRELRDLRNVLEERAAQYRGVLLVGRTHGQHAQPITFGVKLLGYLDMIARAESAFDEAVRQILVMKLSGAVGMYGTLGPEVEVQVGNALDLQPVIATQIIPLDRRARLANEMALIASVLQKIAHDLWLMSQTEVGEIREPFGKAQKGSSAMPHKKNPITLEQIMGLARSVQGAALSVMQNIATAHERDISHSSVERLDLVDAFGILHHMLRGLTRVVEGMEVFPDRMLANLNVTFGTIASQRVEMWLKSCGMPAEAAYRAVQRACAEAMDRREHLQVVLSTNTETRPYIESDQKNGLSACFDWKKWVLAEHYIYYRAGFVRS